jgi:integrase
MAICQTASSLAQERETMRRKRFQKGSVRSRKHGKTRVWVGQWWEGGCRRSKVLGRVAEMPKSAAEAQLGSILRHLNEGAGIIRKPVYTFGQYLEDIFLPLCRRKWKESSRMTTEPRMLYHLKPIFGGHVLHSITREQLQAFLDQKALTLSRSTVDHLRWDLKNIMNTAMSDGLVQPNPTDALFTPPCKPGPEKLCMTPADIRLALSALGLRERLIFRLAVFSGMRPGEIFAISCGNVHRDSILVDRRVYNGDIDTPKGRKGKRTSRVAALSDETLKDLAVWRLMLLDDSLEAYLFPSEKKTPLSRNNVWKRNMLPKTEEGGTWMGNLPGSAKNECIPFP